VGQRRHEAWAQDQVGQADQGEDGVEDHEVDLAEGVVDDLEAKILIGDAGQVCCEAEDDEGEKKLNAVEREDDMFESHCSGRREECV